MTLLTLGTQMSSTGFVTLKSLTAAAMAGQALLTTQPFVFEVSPAPEPRDIIWSNVAVPIGQIRLRVQYMEVLVFFLSIFWGSLMVAIFTMVAYLQRLPLLQQRDDYSKGANALISLVIDYLPQLLLLLVLQVLPWIFYLVSYKYERLKTHSSVQMSIMGRYFYYQMINIFATIIGGGIVAEIKKILDDYRNIVIILGCSLPNVGVYFIQVSLIVVVLMMMMMMMMMMMAQLVETVEMMMMMMMS